MVAEHFKSKSNPFPVCHSLLIDVSDREIILKAPTLPVVDLGLRDEPCWVPPELCTVLPNQMYGRKLSGDLKREMVNFAAGNLEPNDSNEIAKALDKLGLSRKNSTLVRDLPPLLFVQLTFLKASLD